jgi:hypothetical protein
MSIKGILVYAKGYSYKPTTQKDTVEGEVNPYKKAKEGTKHSIKRVGKQELNHKSGEELIQKKEQ